MTNQLEEFIEEKSIRCAYGVKPFIAGEKYISEQDLKEFFEDKVIFTVDKEDEKQLALMFKILSENEEINDDVRKSDDFKELFSLFEQKALKGN